jgi:hypothetical protein
MSASAILVFDFSRPQHHLRFADRVRTACEQTLSKADQNGTFSGWCEQLDQAENPCIAGSSSFATRYCCDMTSLTRIAYGSRVLRHGRSLPFWLNQAKRSSSTRRSLDEPPEPEKPENGPCERLCQRACVQFSKLPEAERAAVAALSASVEIRFV